MKLIATPPATGWTVQAEGDPPEKVGRGDYEGDALLDYLIQFGSTLTGPIQLVDPDHPDMPPTTGGASRHASAAQRPGQPRR